MSQIDDHILECERRYGDFLVRFTKLEQETRLLLYLASGLAAGVGLLVYNTIVS